MEIKKFYLPLLALAFAASTSCFAEMGRGFLSLNGGVFFPSNSSLALTPGFSAGYKILPLLYVGAEYQSYSIGIKSGTNDGNAEINTSTSIYAVDATMRLPNSLPGLSGGVRFGWLTTTTVAGAANSSAKISFSTGGSWAQICPHLGYEFFFSAFSVGGELEYIMGLGNGSNRILGLGVLGRLWF